MSQSQLYGWLCGVCSEEKFLSEMCNKRGCYASYINDIDRGGDL